MSIAFLKGNHTCRHTQNIHSKMTNHTEAATKRKAEIVHMIEESDFLTVPTQKTLAKHFGVSQQQIQKDMVLIRKEMPGQEPMLAGIQIDKFVDRAIARLNELRQDSDTPRSEREMILAQMSILRTRIEIGQKLGLIEQVAQKVDNTIKIQWGKKA